MRIFSSICERAGTVGGGLVIALCVVLQLRFSWQPFNSNRSKHHQIFVIKYCHQTFSWPGNQSTTKIQFVSTNYLNTSINFPPNATLTLKHTLAHILLSISVLPNIILTISVQYNYIDFLSVHFIVTKYLNFIYLYLSSPNILTLSILPNQYNY